jgi:hypothetical protein
MSTTHTPIATDALTRVRAFLVENWDRRAEIEYLSKVDYWVLMRIKNCPDRDIQYSKLVRLAETINKLTRPKRKKAVAPKRPVV